MYLLSGIEYLEAKTELAHIAARKFDTYNPEYIQADTLQNQIIRGTLTEAAALESLNKTITGFLLMKAYLGKNHYEPV